MKERLLWTSRGEVSRIAAQLARLPLFEHAGHRALRRIAAEGYAVTIPANWPLIHENTPADKTYIILDGAVDVRRADAGVIRLGAGNVVGEMAILESNLRSATVVAATPLEVLHFTADAVRRLYTDVRPFRAALHATYSERGGQVVEPGIRPSRA